MIIFFVYSLCQGVTDALLLGGHSQNYQEHGSALADRAFEYVDEICGSRAYNLSDMLNVFHAEQSYWAKQGEFNPWWAVLTGFSKGKAIPPEEELKFYQSGVHDVSRMRSRLEQHGIVLKAGENALDFGCGVGRMSNGLAAFGFAKTICLDQAQSFLESAFASLASLAGQGAVVADVVDRIQFVQSTPDLLAVVPPNSMNLVHSVITLQHMIPLLQVAYIEQFCDVLRSGGVGYFTIPVSMAEKSYGYAYHCDGNTEETLMRPSRHLEANVTQEGMVMAMHFTPKHEVIRHLEARGCVVVGSGDDSSIGNIGESNYFVFKKP